MSLYTRGIIDLILNLSVNPDNAVKLKRHWSLATQLTNWLTDQLRNLFVCSPVSSNDAGRYYYSLKR